MKIFLLKKSKKKTYESFFTATYNIHSKVAELQVIALFYINLLLATDN